MTLNNVTVVLQITFTGYEAKTIEGCPTAEWVIRRSCKEELFLVVYRFHKGHTCNAPYTVVSIVLWEGLSQARALQLYRQLTDTLPKYGCPTPRKCEKNERSVIKYRDDPLPNRAAHSFFYYFFHLQQ